MEPIGIEQHCSDPPQSPLVMSPAEVVSFHEQTMRLSALEAALKLLVVENDALREESGKSARPFGYRDFTPAEIARGASLPGKVLVGECAVSVRLES